MVPSIVLIEEERKNRIKRKIRGPQISKRTDERTDGQTNFEPKRPSDVPQIGF